MNKVDVRWNFYPTRKYNRELLKLFRMANAEKVAIPMTTNEYLDKDEKGKKVSAKLYKGMIEYLPYLTTSKPNILFNVYMCTHFKACLKESHLTTLKKILKYLTHIQQLRL